LASASALQVEHADAGVARAPILLPAAAIAGLRECEDKQMRIWGIDSVGWRALKRRPILAKGQLFRAEDYPLASAFSGISGLVVVRLTVGAGGGVQDCTAVRRSGHSTLDQRTCSVFTRRARFSSALDANGRPIAAPYVVAVRYCASVSAPGC